MKTGKGIQEIGVSDICIDCPEKLTCPDLAVLRELADVKIMFMLICERRGKGDGIKRH